MTREAKKKPGRLRRLRDRAGQLRGAVDLADALTVAGVAIAFAGLWRLDPSAALIPLGLFLVVVGIRSAA